ncbi:hypothetical protein OA56_08865 [Tepidiphilus sp. HLB4]
MERLAFFGIVSKQKGGCLRPVEAFVLDGEETHDGSKQEGTKIFIGLQETLKPHFMQPAFGKRGPQ